MILNFLCLLTLIIHNQWISRVKRQRNLILTCNIYTFSSLPKSLPSLNPRWRSLRQNALDRSPKYTCITGYTYCNNNSFPPILIENLPQILGIAWKTFCHRTWASGQPISIHKTRVWKNPGPWPNWATYGSPYACTTLPKKK